MQSDASWKELNLGDVIELKRGYDLPKGKRSVGVIPIVSSSGTSDFHSEAMVKGPGVVTGRYGTIGQVFYIDGDFWPLNTTLYVRDFKGSDPRFISYFLRTLDFQAYSDKGAVPGVNRNHLHTAKVRIPALPVQKAIARVLDTLDSKIDLNRRINQTLEAMAQAIFKSWFVDFDPVKAKIAAIEQGEDPLRAAMRAISGKTEAELDHMPRAHHDQLATTAALFPDAMEESELGDIPKGWEVKRVGDLIELAYGKALKSTDRKQGSVPVYGSGGVTGYHNEALVPHGAIIVGRKGTVGSLYWEDKPFFPIDTTFYVKPKAVPMTYCFYAMQMLGLDKMNTDAAVPGLNRENVYRLGLVKPSASVLDPFDRLLGRIRNAMRSNETASQSLAELRDMLLPKLLSGELAIGKIVGRADITGAI
jgi:type I restriction enzyme S subunit